MTEPKTLTEADLAGFTGTDQYFKNPMFPRYNYSEGVRHMAEHGGAYWLLDVIFSHQISPKARAEEFQVWTLKRDDVGNGAVVFMTDGNDEAPIIRQRIEFTDFPLRGIRFYLENNVLYLPSER